MYVPVNSLGASQDHPICQTYIDTVLRGCLKWGGESLAEEVREIETERETESRTTRLIELQPFCTVYYVRHEPSSH